MGPLNRTIRAQVLQEIRIAERKAPGTIAQNKHAVEKQTLVRSPYLTFGAQDREWNYISAVCGCFYGNALYRPNTVDIGRAGQRAISLATDVRYELDITETPFTHIEDLFYEFLVTAGDGRHSGPLNVQRFLRWFYRLLEIAEAELARKEKKGETFS